MTRLHIDIDKRAALAEAESWAGSEADYAFLAGVFFALCPDKYNPGDFTPVAEFFHNLDKHMKQDIYEYLHDLGWSFSHETEDGKRLWARAFYDPYTKNMTCRFDDEEHLIEMAMEAMGA